MSFKVSKIGVLLRPSTPSLKAIYDDFKAIAQKNDIEVRISSDSAAMIGISGSEFKEMCAWCDIIVSFGGDGTLISSLRKALPFNKAILGINTGRLGFLTAIGLSELDDFVLKLKMGDFAICKIMPLNAEIHTKNRVVKLLCINEFIISKKDIAGMIKIAAKINGKFFNSYFGDGLIIGTPAGSTAYNISAGGAIVYPYNRNIILTPICAHSLTQKSLILNDSFELEFSLQEYLDLQYSKSFEKSKTNIKQDFNLNGYNLVVSKDFIISQVSNLDSASKHIDADIMDSNSKDSKDFNIKDSTSKDSNASIVVDGQDVFEFNMNDRLVIKAASQNALLIYDKNRDYFEVLREKFSWGL